MCFIVTAEGTACDPQENEQILIDRLERQDHRSRTSNLNIEEPSKRTALSQAVRQRRNSHSSEATPQCSGPG